MMNYPANLIDIDIVGQVMQRDRSLVLVAVIGAGEDGAGAVTILRVTDRQHDRAPGGVVARVRNLQKAVLQAVAFKVDSRRYRIRHAYFTNSRCSTFARLWYPESVITTDSVISRPPSSSHNAGMK